ncbi:MAG: glycosyltransferase family 2 protein [Patescibacteria group bacterium]
MAFKLTIHTIVKNEERWIKSSLLSIIESATEILVYDTGSTDKTIKLIQSINSPKIKFKQFNAINRKGLVVLRNQQIKETKSDWFLILDGDEIWPEANLIQLIKAMQKARPSTLALVNRTRNCIGDLNHFLPESKGNYQIGPWRGHLNIRAIRNLPGLKVTGEYPAEAYVYQGKKLQDQPENLEFVDTWYYHATHLKRTGWWHGLKVMDRLQKFKPFYKFS